MAKRIIDLRKNKEAEVIPAAVQEEPVVREEPRETLAAEPVAAAPTSPPTPAKKMVEWSALEYEMQLHSRAWFFTVGALALILVIFGVLVQSYFFIALVILASAVLVMYTRREPARISFAIDETGVRAGRKRYELSDLKSFWVFDGEEVRELSLETTKTLSPFLRLPLGDADLGEVKTVLAQYLPEKEHEEFASDKIARSIGL